MTNGPTSLNNLKTKVDDSDVGKLKTAPAGLKRLSDLVDNEVFKNTKFNTLKTKVNNLEKFSWSNYISSCKSVQHRWVKFREENWDFDKKIPDTSDLVTATVLNTKISEVQSKIPNTCNLVTTAILNTVWQKNSW